VDASAIARPLASSRDAARRGFDFALAELGGPARSRVVIVLAAVLGLDGADKGTVSSTAGNLERAFGIGNTEIGLLVTASTLVGAIFTLPVGALTDRVNRTRLLSASILIWAVAMFFSGAAQSYVWLILSRIALGAVTATAGPTVASLTGDYFPAKDRARMYGFILAGELVGTGVGFAVSGYITAHVGWRYAFWWLIVPSALLGYVVWRLAEPARGGQSRIQPGQREIPDAKQVHEQDPARQREEAEQALKGTREGAGAQIERQYAPYGDQVLTEDPGRKSLWWAVRYVLRVRTDVVIIVVSALGYFYFSGLRTFAIIFAQDHYGISKTLASSLVIVIGAGGLVGVYAGGRATDMLAKRGVVNARVIVPMIVLLSISLFAGPAFWTTMLWVAIPLLVVAAGLLGAGNPPQDAARLDVIHPHLWGRSEGVRTALRSLLEAAAPVTFGLVSQHLFGGHQGFGATTAKGGNQGLSLTFLLFLVVLIAAGLIVTIALRTYPHDVATANASVRNTIGHDLDEADRQQPAGARPNAAVNDRAPPEA
jgi:predicted MFS family arabinose efflux permease